MDKLDKIYLLNHEPFIDRLNIISSKLRKENIDYELVQHFSPDEIDYDKEMIGWEHYEKIEIIHPYGKYHNFSKKISIGSLSLILKHLWCYNNQIQNNYENVLILEDDAVIPDDFQNYLYNNIIEFENLRQTDNVEMLMIGTAFDMHSKSTSNKCAKYSENQLVRCTHAYILNIDATKKIINRFFPYNLPIDFKLNEIITLEKIKVAWSEPGILQSGMKEQYGWAN